MAKMGRPKVLGENTKQISVQLDARRVAILEQLKESTQRTQNSLMREAVDELARKYNIEIVVDSF